MGILDRFRGGQAPDWAPFFTAASYARFRRIVLEDAARRGWDVTEDRDGLIVDADNPETRREYGLVNLAQRCHISEPDDWPAIVETHFDGLLRMFEDEDAVPSAWEDCRPILKLRLFGPEVGLPDDTVRYPVANGLDAVLALDLPTSVAQLRRENIVDWPPADELYRVALGNVRAEEPGPEIEELDLGGAKVTVIEGESFFVSSRVLFLADVVDVSGPWGALVIVPVRTFLAVHPIRDTAVLQAVPALARIAAEAHRDGPGSVSPTVFWWHAGAMTPIDVEVGERGLSVRPPAAFVEILEAIAREQGA